MSARIAIVLEPGIAAGDLVPAPAGQVPAVEITRHAGEVPGAVDRRRAAQPATIGLHFLAHARLLHRRIGAEIGRVAHDLHEAAGHLDEGVLVVAAILDQQDAGLRIGAQAVGQHASGRACANDDVIEKVAHAGPRPQALF
jgi:hypothetical protein